jgi:hypothetical protein
MYAYTSLSLNSKFDLLSQVSDAREGTLTDASIKNLYLFV